jgi:hypothetical protein
VLELDVVPVLPLLVCAVLLVIGVTGLLPAAVPLPVLLVLPAPLGVVLVMLLGLVLLLPVPPVLPELVLPLEYPVLDVSLFIRSDAHPARAMMHSAVAHCLFAFMSCLPIN